MARGGAVLEDPAKPSSQPNENRKPIFPINTKVELHDGSTFEGVDGLKEHLFIPKGRFCPRFSRDGY